MVLRILLEILNKIIRIIYYLFEIKKNIHFIFEMLVKLYSYIN